MMAEYIEREALLDALYDADVITFTGMKILEKFPAADVQPVKHGRWKWSEGGQCSECGFHNSNFGYDYCPNCGAKMDGEIRAF